jgi:hypothetical protein
MLDGFEVMVPGGVHQRGAAAIVQSVDMARPFQEALRDAISLV